MSEELPYTGGIVVMPQINTDGGARTEAARAQIEAILRRYYDNYFASGQARHTLVGPPGKMLTQFRQGEPVETLVSIGVRAHRAAMRNEPPPAAQTALHELGTVLATIGSTLSNGQRAHFANRINNLAYVMQLRRALEARERVFDEWRAWVKRHYANDARLRTAWGDNKVSLETLPYPTTYESARKKLPRALVDDIDRFRAERSGGAVVRPGEVADESEGEDELFAEGAR